MHRSNPLADAEASTRFKAMSGKLDQAGGLAVRLKDQNNYYVTRANALEDNVRFYRVVNGRRQQLASANVKVAAGEWHTLGLAVDEGGQRDALRVLSREAASIAGVAQPSLSCAPLSTA
ncbi:MAG: hypothetical protein K0R61_4669 [Microvirga sp.]|nr:hypothetical protein [Microvirga sp.]